MHMFLSPAWCQQQPFPMPCPISQPTGIPRMLTKAVSSRHTAVHLENLCLSPFCWLRIIQLLYTILTPRKDTKRKCWAFTSPAVALCQWRVSGGGCTPWSPQHRVEWFWMEKPWFHRGSPMQRSPSAHAVISSFTHPFRLFSWESGDPSSLLEFSGTVSQINYVYQALSSAAASLGNYSKTIFRCILWGRPNSYMLWEWLLRAGRAPGSVWRKESL